MKRALPYLILLAVLACGGDDDDDAAEGPVRGDTTAAARQAIFPEPEALGLLHAIGDAEIAMARTAREVSQNEEVLSFARVVIADHQGIKQLLSAPAQTNALSDSIRAAGDSIARELLTMEGGFNNTYIEEQIKANQQALQLMDTAIIPSARDTATRSLLRQLRPTIAAHLQRALQLLAMRRRQANERGEPWVSGFQRGTTVVGAPTIETQPAAPSPQPQPQPEPQPMPLPQPDTLPPPTSTSNM